MAKALTGAYLAGGLTLGVMALTAGVLLRAPSLAQGLESVVRLTARTSLLLFLLVFCSSALWAHWPGAFSRWLRQQRRYVALGFAGSYLVHAGLFTWLASLGPLQAAQVWQPAMILVGGSGYAVLLLLVLTSNNAAQRWLGAARWQRLHCVGVYWLWAQFLISMAKRLPVDGLLYGAWVALLLAAMALRWWPQPAR
jgi:hypothetical protein